MSLQDLYAQNYDQVQFLMVYIREAHPKDGWWLGGGIFGWLLERYSPRSATEVVDPRTLAERREVAGQCREALQYGIRTYVDTMDDAVSEAYASIPTRLYLIGMDGRVVYAGGLGPYGFKPAALKAAIENYLTQGVMAARGDPVTTD